MIISKALLQRIYDLLEASKDTQYIDPGDSLELLRAVLAEAGMLPAGRDEVTQ